MSSIKSIIKRKTIRLISSFYDPLVTTRIGNQNIKIPFSHPLRENVIVHPQMNYNLARIIKYATEIQSNIKVIDIGANIGDTVAYIKNYTDAPVLCIDGDDKYIEILKENVAQYNNVSVCKTFVGQETKEIFGELKKERGTGIVTESSNKMSIRTIENILEEFPAFNDSKVLKIDTDGFDTVILKGCKNYLLKQKPVLFFEFDPHYISKNDDTFSIVPYLKECGYKHLIFYMNNGDYLLSADIEQEHLFNELIHFFSGRGVTLYTDICAFTPDDKVLFEKTVEKEIEHFKNFRGY